MQYRRLGRAGLKVSELSYGSWVTYGKQVDTSLARELMVTAYDQGVNFFDNAEVYAGGQAEVVMGEALKALGWSRLNFVVSTKLFWGISEGMGTVNGSNTLNRKYLHSAINGSLKRLQLDYVDLVYCHRPDPETPIAETVQALHDIIVQGKALYWGTSEWSADEIRAAYEVADRNGWHKPIVEQPQYHLFHRNRVEREYCRLYEDIGIGLTTWSPLASGLLTGKYKAGIPNDSRGALPGMSFLRDGLTDKQKNSVVGKLEELARDLGGSVAQLAIAWVITNPNVSSAILGASKPAQLLENLKAINLSPKLTPEVLKHIDELTRGLAR
ncbi:MAG TPA: aldo/keto reductase [Polyangiales bacterium]|jgi:voltage-dependent potassium channel beta subunit|nr:aldo/keto reductase [Polyangiales bacterium]